MERFMRRKNKFLTALIVYVLVAIVLIMGASLVKTSNSFVDGSPAFGGSVNEAALITIEGIITSSGGGGGMFGGAGSPGSMALVEEIKDDAADDSIKGIIVRVDSPGGSAAASDEIWNALRKAAEVKPVVVSMGDVAASGGYYISTAGDFIYANPSTLTGSIGVIFDVMEYSGLFDKLGIKSNTIHAGEFKDIGSPTRPMTDKERQLLQALLDQVHEQFISRVIQGREGKMSEEEVRKYATGMIFTGEQAKAIHLVDEVGGFEDAFAKLEELCGNKNLELREKPPMTFWDFLMSGGKVSTPVPSMDALGFVHPLARLASILYLSPLAANLTVR
jgi:protease IV